METGRISAGVEPAAPVPARERTGEAPAGVPVLGADAAWRLLLAVRAAVDAECGPGELAFTVAGEEVRPGADGAATVVVDRRARRVARGLERFGPPARELLELFLAQAVTPREAGCSVAILGQTLDGFIATRSGDSRYINGSAALVHLHRTRALCDAVIVGASTATLDEPRLTTRHVEGPNAVRVVVDPNGRLPATSPLLHDGAAPTLVLRRGEGREREEPVTDQASVLRLPEIARAARPGPHRRRPARARPEPAAGRGRGRHGGPLPRGGPARPAAAARRPHPPGRRPPRRQAAPGRAPGRRAPPRLPALPDGRGRPLRPAADGRRRKRGRLP